MLGVIPSLKHLSHTFSNDFLRFTPIYSSSKIHTSLNNFHQITHSKKPHSIAWLPSIILKYYILKLDRFVFVIFSFHSYVEMN